LPGRCYETQKDFGNALAAARRACEMGPELVVCWFNLVACLFTQGHLDHAIGRLNHCVKLGTGNMHLRGHVLASVPQIFRLPPKEAEGQYRDILAQNPASGQAWSGLAMLKPMSLGLADIAADAQGVATN